MSAVPPFIMAPRSLEPLVKLYEDYLKDCKSKVVRGISIPQLNPPGIERALAEDAGFYAQGNDADDMTVYNARRQAFAGIIYDALKTAARGDEDLLQIVNEKVIDPVLDGAFAWLATHKGLEQTSREEFIDGFAPEIKRKIGLATYIKPIVLLRVLTEKPELADKIQQNSSTFTHRLFIERKQTTKEIDREIAGATLELIPEELAAKISRITEYVSIRNSTGGSLGRYKLPQSLDWLKNGADAEKELDELYTGLPVKKAIYETLADCLDTQIASVSDSDKSVRQWNKLSEFGLNTIQFAVLQQSLKAYAINQLLYVWQQDVTREVPRLKLARQVRLIPNSSPQALRIHDGYSKSTLEFKPDSNMMNTTRYLPFCVAILNKYYQKARELMNEK